MTPRTIALTLLITFAALPDVASAQRNSGARRAFWAARSASAPVAAPTIVIDTASFAFVLAIPAATDSAETPNATAPRLRGVDIVATGTSSFVIQLHSGMLGEGAPLYVIDGAPAVELPNGIDWFKPADIARVEVLKTAAELSRYGTRGANGVIVITTKNAKNR